jgi:periplasmic protein TonB
MLTCRVLKEKSNIQSLEDIAFDGRNKEYGAYVLLTTYKRRLRFSFVAALVIFATLILFFGGWMKIPWIRHKVKIPDVSSVSVAYDRTLVTLLHEPPKLQSAHRQQLNLVIKPITEDKIRIEQPENLEEITQITDVIPVDVMKDEAIARIKKADSAATVQLKTETIPDSVYYALDSPPAFPGGSDALYLFIYGNLRYPVNALHRHIQGTVNVSFIVKTDGSIGRVAIIKGTDPQLDGEAVRVIAAMSKWKPAVYRGRAIASMQIIPITFTLSLP